MDTADHARADDAHTAFQGYRSVAIGAPGLQVSRSGDAWYLRSIEALMKYPDRVTDRLVSGAQLHPDRWLIARRNASGQWIGISYAEMLERARSIGQALLDRKLSVERPILVLSGNDLEHIQLALGAMWAGIPYAPISPAYSLVSTDFSKLRHAVELLTPGAVFAANASKFSKAIQSVVPSDVEVISAAPVSGNLLADRKVTSFDELLATHPTTVDTVQANLSADAIAKFLFTSGSTSLPKAVPTTHRMMCSNQQMLLQTFPEFALEPPILVDWLSWNHTFGGSHNVGIALFNGGTLYIDDGKPVEGKFEETLRNLKEISPTIYFNVPKGWEELTDALERDPELRASFFARIKVYFFAGAGLSQSAWDRLERVTERYCSERIRIMGGLGMTETAPSCLFTTGPVLGAGYVGLPAPGCEVKLVPVASKMEVRFKGPHVMSGYWRAEGALAAKAFDEEGYYCSGDALRFVDPENPQLGLMFDGRIAEDFKLSSGTFVSVGPLRSHVVSIGAPFVQDVVVTGMNRDDIGLLVFPRVEECRALVSLPETATTTEVLSAPEVRTHFVELLRQCNARATGTASCVARVRLMDASLSLDRGEITDKGSVNQQAVIKNWSALVDALHAATENDSLTILAE